MFSTPLQKNSGEKDKKSLLTCYCSVLMPYVDNVSLNSFLE